MADDTVDPGAFDVTEFLDNRDLDPVTLQVIGGEFDTIAQEMGYKLIRSSYSSIIRESEDVGAGIFTKEGLELAESDFTPMHVGSLPGYLEGMYDTFEERGVDPESVIGEGDVFIHNHPYYGASHSPDMAVAIPIFHEGDHIAWAANTAHLVDIGQGTPGGGIDFPDVYAEGMLFRATKIVEAGEDVDSIWNFIDDNVRAPKEVIGDIQAMIASCRVGERRFLELVEEYGRDELLDAGEDLMDYAEMLLRSEIDDLPDGTYHEVGYLDDDGVNRDEPVKVDVKVQIEGSDLTVDLSDSADESPNGFNCPRHGTTDVAVYFTIRAILMDTYTHEEFLPMNSGTFEPIEVVTRKGTIFDPQKPRSAHSRINQVDLMGDLIIKAMSDVVPDRVCAGTCAQCFSPNYSGEKRDTEGDYWVYVEVNEGAYGGRPVEDGLDAVGGLMHNTRNEPVENLELSYPLRVDRYELREDGHAAGKHRGGHGIVREIAFLETTHASVTGDGKNHIPHGLFGGEDGIGGELWHLGIDEEADSPPGIYSRRDRSPTPDMTERPGIVDVTELPSKIARQRFDVGDRFVIRTPMGGGYGPPEQRPPEAVYRDYLDGFVTRKKARDSYKVVITDEGLDEEATEQLRQE